MLLIHPLKEIMKLIRGNRNRCCRHKDPFPGVTILLHCFLDRRFHPHDWHRKAGAKFLRGIAWLLWIGGAIVSIAGSFVTVPGYYESETEFLWTSFLTSLLTYLFEGGFVMCFAEALDNLQAIRDWMCGFKGLKEKKQ